MEMEREPIQEVIQWRARVEMCLKHTRALCLWTWTASVTVTSQLCMRSGVQTRVTVYSYESIVLVPVAPEAPALLF